MKKIVCSVVFALLMLSVLSFGVSAGGGADFINPQYSSDGYYYDIVEEEVAIRGYYGENSDITIPSILDGYRVTSISDYAFCGNETITSVTIKSNISSIGQWDAFSNCPNLKYITVEESNQFYSSVDGVLFDKNKTQLIQYPCGNTRTSYIISNGVVKINSSALSYSYNLIDITIPDSIINIDAMMFSECNSLENIVIGKNIETIEYFYNCPNLKNIIVNSDNKYYSNDEKGVLFNKDKSLLIQYPCGNESEEYIIPSSVVTIGDGAFSNSKNLTDIIIPDGVVTLGYSSFEYCSQLSNIIIPDSVKVIDGYAFNDCTSLTKIVLPDSVATIAEYAFCNCDNIEDVYYTGTEEQWNNIAIEDYNDCLINASIHFNHICIDENINGLCDECEEDTSDVYVGEKFYVAFEGKEVYHSFIPTVTGNYTIKSLDDQFDPYCTLYDENMNWLAYDDDSDVDRNFEITHYYEKGKTYKFSFKSYDFGKYPVIITYNDEIEEPSTESNTNPHTHAYTSTTKAPTCTATGTKAFTCSCGDTYTETVKAKGHTAVTDKAIAATCTKTGLSEGSHCSECNTVIEKQKTTVKKAHTSDKGTVTKKATYKATGTKTYKCTACKITLKAEQIARLTLSKVSGLKASSIKTTSIKFTWNKVTGAEKYEVYYSTNGKSWKKVTATKNTVTIKKLKTGTIYKVKVRAVAGSNKGSYSSVLTTSTKPSKVTLSKLTAGKKKLTAQWKTISGASGYEVTYSTSKKFTKKTTKTVTIKKAKTKKTTLKKLKSGKKYYVKIRAYKTVNGKKIYGSYSKVMTVKVK